MVQAWDSGVYSSKYLSCLILNHKLAAFPSASPHGLVSQVGAEVLTIG